MNNTRIAVVISIAFLLQTGCTAESPTEMRSLELQYDALAPTTTAGVVNGIASIVPAIRITDRRTHAPIPNVKVEFRTVGGGSVENPLGYTTW